MKSMVRDFKSLGVWGKSRDFARQLYESSSAFPPAERFGLTSQLRRAGVSIMTNIAEGCGRKTERDFLSFLHIALGSSKECVSLLILCEDLGYISKEQASLLIGRAVELEKMLSVFVQKVEERIR